MYIYYTIYIRMHVHRCVVARRSARVCVCVRVFVCACVHIHHGHDKHVHVLVVCGERACSVCSRQPMYMEEKNGFCMYITKLN